MESLLSVGWVEIGLAVALVAILFYYAWTSAYTYWKRRNVPYLEPSFPFGHAGDTLLFRKNFRDSWQDLYTRLGDNPFGGVYSLRTPVLVIKDPALIKLMLTKDFNHFTDHGLFPSIDHEPLLHNIFNMEGDAWRRTRIKLTPTFTSGKMKMMFPILEECARGLRSFFDGTFKNGKTFEAKDLMARFTSDAIVNCVFGLKAASVNNVNMDMYLTGKRLFGKSLWRKLSNVALVEAPTLYRLLKMHFIGYDECENVAGIIAQTIRFREENGVYRNDFLDLIIKLKNNQSIDDKDIGSSLNNNGTSKNGAASFERKKDVNAMKLNDLLAQIVGFFIAGYETSSSALAFCLYELARNPDVQIKLQRELDEAYERNATITYQMLQELAYMDNVISETLRMYSTLPVLNRTCVKAYRIPDSDVVVDVGCKVVIPTYALHHDPKYYPDPLKFDPDRFLEENVKARPGYTFMPFGEGPRICIGMRFAKMEMKLALATLFSEFNLTLNPKTAVPLTIARGELLTTTRDDILVDLCDRKQFSA